MNPKIVKGIGVIGMLLGGLASLISTWSEKQERETETKEYVEKTVKEEMQKYLPEPDTVAEKEEGSL